MFTQCVNYVCRFSSCFCTHLPDANKHLSKEACRHAYSANHVLAYSNTYCTALYKQGPLYRMLFGHTLLITSFLILVSNESVRFQLDFNKTILWLVPVSFGLPFKLLQGDRFRFSAGQLPVSFSPSDPFWYRFRFSAQVAYDSLLVSFRFTICQLPIHCFLASNSILVAFRCTPYKPRNHFLLASDSPLVASIIFY